MEDIIESIVEEPLLPTAYKLTLSYTLATLRKKRKYNSFDLNYIIKKPIKTSIFDRTKFLQAKINLNVQLENLYMASRLYKQVQYIKFKSVSVINNIFIAETLVARGI